MSPADHLPFDPASLHPAFREKVNRLIAALAAEGLPFRPFEGFRTPVRQDWLYQQGRTRPGAVVTKARAWESYHQYGLAVDFVLYQNGKWSWETAGGRMRDWNRMIALGKAQGLEPLRFELPHLQLGGLRIANLRKGAAPEGGDSSWWEAIAKAAGEWSGSPANPPFDWPPETRVSSRRGGRRPSRRRSPR